MDVCKPLAQGHAHAMYMLGGVVSQTDRELGVAWFEKGAKAGLPDAMFALGCSLDTGDGVAAPDYPAAAGWYTRAAVAGHPAAASNLHTMSAVGRGRGVI